MDILDQAGWTAGFSRALRARIPAFDDDVADDMARLFWPSTGSYTPEAGVDHFLFLLDEARSDLAERAKCALPD